MPIFSFEGRNEKTGEVVRGLREAQTHALLGQDLLSEGILLTRYASKKQKLPGTSILSAVFNRVPIIERVLFSRYFALMLKAGMDVKRSLQSLQQQSRSKPMKQALESVYQDIERGKTLADSMKMFPVAFPPIFISFIEVGETTGRLQESLEILAVQLQKEYELKRAVMGGLLYPLVIIISLIAVAIAMMFFVVPKLVEVFAGFNVELPLPTRVLIVASDIFQSYWILLFIGAFLGFVSLWMLMRVKSFNATVNNVLLYVPIIGPIMQKINLGRFSRNLSSLLVSGVSFIRALEIMGQNTPHPSYAKVLAEAREHVKEGKELSSFLEDFQRLFPPIVISIIKVGEETGALDQVLAETALFYESEVDQTMKNLTSIMEPVLMVVVGLAVGALAVSIISPIYDLVNVI